MPNSDPSLEALHICLRTLTNAREGFRTAAEEASSEDLKTIMNRLGQSRATMAAEVKEMIREVGGTPKQTSSLTGRAHQGWIKIRSTLAGNSDKAILKECIRGESLAVDTFEDTLKNGLAKHHKEKLHAFLKTIREDLDLIKTATAE